MNCGIIGLPNVGKSTIFSALTAAPAQAANYPFCTIDPNVGIVEVPDARLERIHQLIKAERRVSASTEFVDIAGLVKGASQGEGLGNQFLANIRSVGIVAHVVRCFEDENVIHVGGQVDPVNDIEIVNTELVLADLQTVEKRLEKNTRQLKAVDPKIRREAMAVASLLEKVAAHLEQGKPIRTLDMDSDDLLRIGELCLITAKKQLYVCNVSENGINNEFPYISEVKQAAAAENSEIIILSGKLEAEIATLESPEERSVFMEDAGISESGLSALIRSAYRTLGLRTFYTVGGKENRAWTFREGLTASQCAGIIHSDFERGFIKAEVFHCDDLFTHTSETAVKSAGRLRVEGREYPVHDGDVLHFKFNV